ncbi:hypothetical protein ALC56_08915, partial [Trachymyrmex septentrionalis]
IKNFFRFQIEGLFNNFSALLVANVLAGGANLRAQPLPQPNRYAPPRSFISPRPHLRPRLLALYNNGQTDRHRRRTTLSHHRNPLFLLRSSPSTRGCAEERREASASTSSSASASCRGRRTIVVGSERLDRASLRLARLVSSREPSRGSIHLRETSSDSTRRAGSVAEREGQSLVCGESAHRVIRSRSCRSSQGPALSPFRLTFGAGDEARNQVTFHAIRIDLLEPSREQFRDVYPAERAAGESVSSKRSVTR